MLNHLPIKIKLILLAGVPVIGALILSFLVASDAQRRLESAEALGSIEDLAELAMTISETVNGIQRERAETAYALGRGVENLDAELADERKEVDTQFKRLVAFFDARANRALPERLSAGIMSAKVKYAKASEIRKALSLEDGNLEELATYTEGVVEDLIGATAALKGLSDDGVMLRNISGLVSVMELKERAAREQALLSYVFAKSTFPPGGYKRLVNLVTEQEVFDKVLRQSTSDDLVLLYDERLQGREMDRALELRQVGLDTMDDDFGVDAAEWVELQGRKVEVLRELAVKLNERVKVAALARLKEANQAVTTSFSLSGGVVLISLLLAIVIATGISRAVGALVAAAHDVQHKQDFAVRAEKKSNDELGSLTDAFNHMLDGIQKRDAELADHRANLERTVEARTAELAKRNEAMRVVLDNVEEGLATINVDGTLEAERSAMFDAWFAPIVDSGAAFHDVLAANDGSLRDMLELGWEGLTDGFLPREMAAEQIPSKLARNGRHFEMTYKPMGTEADFHGALLMVRDVTEELERKKKEAEQREMIAVFEAVMRDRTGFIEFFNDTEKLVTDVVADFIHDEAVLKRVIHTIKGNTGIYGVASVSECCHHVEQSCIDEQRRPSAEELTELECRWTAFAERVRLFANQHDEGILEIEYDELERIIEEVRSRKPHTTIVESLEALKHEPTEVRFARIGEQVKLLAKKLGKEGVQLEIEGNRVRLPSDRWHDFWSSFIHVVRNAIDHGIEAPEERVAAGKPAAGTIRLSSSLVTGNFIIELSDDGRGIDWERVEQKAAAVGLAHKTRKDLIDALFSDGLSTRDEASELSGRGVGMGAVRHACTAMGGVVSVHSIDGKGTTWTFQVPQVGNDVPMPMSRKPGVRPSLAPPPPSSTAARRSA